MNVYQPKDETGEGINRPQTPELRLKSPLMNGNFVFVCQDKLLQLGFLKAHHVDGFFGEFTSRMVRLFQHHRKMPITGVVDNATWLELDKAIAEKGR
jgi:peptidoglycan hydrolase-like protein with peptidoglycan-binding domain